MTRRDMLLVLLACLIPLGGVIATLLLTWRGVI